MDASAVFAEALREDGVIVMTPEQFLAWLAEDEPEDSKGR